MPGCAEVLPYERILNHEAYKVLEMDQEVETSCKQKLRTTRCPIRIDGQKIYSRKSAPEVGEHTDSIDQEF